MRLSIKNKLIVLFLLGSILLYPTTISAAEELEIIAAIDKVLAENSELEIAELRLENAKFDYQKSQADNLTTKSKRARLEAKINYLEAQEQYYNQQSQLLQETLNNYTAVLLQQKEIEVTEKKKELEGHRLDKVQSKLEQGHSNSVEVTEQLNDYQDAEVNLEQAEDNYQQDQRELKFILELNKESDLNIADLSQPNPQEKYLEAIIEQGVKNNLGLESKTENIKLAQQNLKQSQQVATAALDLKQMKNRVKIAKLEEKNAKQELKNELHANYQELEQAVNQLELREQNLAQVKENYSRVQAREEKELASQEEILAAEVQLLEAEYDYSQAVVDYYQQQLELKVAMQLETEELINGLQ